MKNLSVWLRLNIAVIILASLGLLSSAISIVMSISAKNDAVVLDEMYVTMNNLLISAANETSSTATWVFDFLRSKDSRYSNGYAEKLSEGGIFTNVGMLIEHNRKNFTDILSSYEATHNMSTSTLTLGGEVMKA